MKGLPDIDYVWIIKDELKQIALKILKVMQQEVSNGCAS